MTADHTVHVESVARTERYLMDDGHVIDVSYEAVIHDGYRRDLVLKEAQRLWPVAKGKDGIGHRIVGVTTLAPPPDGQLELTP